MRLVRLLGLVMGAVLAAAPVFASRVEYDVRANGQRVSGAEVCFFPAGPLDDFLALFLRSGDVRCVPSDKIIHVPSGSWNVFAEAAGGLVSAHPLVTEVMDTEDLPVDENFHKAVIDVLPGAFVDVASLHLDRGKGERVVVYLHNEGLPLSRAVIRPIRPDATKIVVPASLTVVPIVVRENRPLWVGTAKTLRQREVWRITRDDLTSNAVIAVLTVPRSLLPGTRSVPPPSAELVTKTGRHVTPTLAIRPTPLFADSLLFFRAVPPGESVITIGGADWLPDNVSVSIGDHATDVAIASRQLRALQRPNLHAVWSVARALLTAAPPACDSRAAEPLPLTLRLLSCTTEHADCTERTVADLPSADRGEHLFSRLGVGKYRIELRRGPLSVSSPVFDLGPASDATVALDFAPMEISGRVTRAGAPVHAVVSFRTGSGVSDAVSGEYTAYVTKEPGLDRIRLSLCGEDRAFVHIPTGEVRGNMRYDIDLPSNALHIRTLNAQTGGALAGARVYVNTMGGKNADVELDQRELDETDAEGRASTTDVSANADMTICAYKKGFASQCTERRRFAPTGSTTIELALQPRTEARGKLVTSIPIVRGRLFLTRARQVLTSAAVAQDGSFLLAAIPATSDVLYFTSKSHPLYVLPIPSTVPGAEFVVELREQPRRTFTVMCAGCREDARSPIALLLGGEPVPRDVLASHQNARGGQISLGKNESTLIADVPASAPLAIVKGLAVPETPPQYANVVDQFAVPELLRTFVPVLAVGESVVLP